MTGESLPPSKIERRKVSSLKPAPYNPRKIDNAALAGLTKSIERFGNVQPIIVNARTGFVVGGHQRLKVLKTKGIAETDVVVVDLPEGEEKALNVALNSPHISGEFTADLQLLLEEIKTDDQQLFADLRLDALLGEVVPLPPAGGDPENVPEPPQEANTKPGDLYELGEHRLYCGDAALAESLDAVLGKERVDALVTDPPYGVDYGEKMAFLNEYSEFKGGKKNAQAHAPIANDKGLDYRRWFASWLSLVPWAEYATFHIFMSSTELHSLRMAIDDCGFTWGDYLAWVKNQAVFGPKDYHSKLELILYGWPERHRFYGPKNSESVLAYDRPRKNDLHPTMKPIELMQRLVENGSAAGGVVYEPFAVSGSTLIACERSARRCRAIELDPLYCDVIVRRWEEYTGKKAVRRARERT